MMARMAYRLWITYTFTLLEVRSFSGHQADHTQIISSLATSIISVRSCLPSAYFSNFQYFPLKTGILRLRARDSNMIFLFFLPLPTSSCYYWSTLCASERLHSICKQPRCYTWCSKSSNSTSKSDGRNLQASAQHSPATFLCTRASIRILQRTRTPKTANSTYGWTNRCIPPSTDNDGRICGCTNHTSCNVSFCKTSIDGRCHNMSWVSDYRWSVTMIMLLLSGNTGRGRREGRPGWATIPRAMEAAANWRHFLRKW